MKQAQTLLSVAAAAALALPASAARVRTDAFIEDAVASYDTGWTTASSGEEIAEGAVVFTPAEEQAPASLSFELDAGQTLTYTADSPSAAGKPATVVVSGTKFTIAYERPTAISAGSQAAIIAGQFDEAESPSYYGWTGAMSEDETPVPVWTELSGATPDEREAVDVKIVLDYASGTASFFVDGDQIGSALSLAGDKTQVSAVAFSGKGKIAELDGSYDVNVYTVEFADTYDGTTNTVASVEYDEGAAVALPSDPTRSGYAFTGWTVSGSAYEGGFATSDLFVESTWASTTWTATPVTAGATVNGSQIIWRPTSATYLPANASTGQPAGYGFYHVRFTAPEALTPDNVASARYFSNGSWKPFQAAADGQTAEGLYYMDAWVSFLEADAENVNVGGPYANGGWVAWQYQFAWDGDTSNAQSFTIYANLANITLVKDGETVVQYVDGVAVADEPEPFSIGDAEQMAVLEEAGVEPVAVEDGAFVVNVVVPEGYTAVLLAADAVDGAYADPNEDDAAGTSVATEGEGYTTLTYTPAEGETAKFFKVKFVK